MKLTKILAACAAVFLLGGMANAYAAASQEAEMQQQQIRATGVVVDAQGQPVPGVSVVVKGTTIGTMTDGRGAFALTTNPGAVLEISCIGYAPQQTVALENLRIVLSEDNEFLDEVVVVGYGTQKKANLTGAVSVVDVSKTLEARPVADVAKALQGAVPGLTVMNNNGGIGGSPTLQIRGVGTLSNSQYSNPLIIVDGVAMDDISYLNPLDIENISVLKDAASTSIYGSRAAFGVILITTKAAKKTDRVQVTYTNNFGFRTPTVLPEYPNTVEQMTAFKLSKERKGAVPELFGMVINDNYIEQARAWQERHGWQKSGYREMVAGDDYIVATADTYQLNPDGSRYIDPNTGKEVKLQSAGQANYLADWDVAGIFYKKWTPSQTHTLAVQGSAGNVNYYLSVGYDKEEGTARYNTEQLSKWNVTSNISTMVTPWMQVGLRFNFDKKNYSEPYEIGQGSLQYIWRWGSFFGPYGTINGTDFRALAYRKQAGRNDATNFFTRLGGYTKITLAKGLTLNADYTYNVYDIDRKFNENPVFGINNWSTIVDSAGNITSGYIKTYTAVSGYAARDLSYAFNAYVDYDKTFNHAHHLHLMAGVNAEEGTFQSYDAYQQGLLDTSLPEFNLAIGTQNVYNVDYKATYGPKHTHWGTAGYFGRINYDYKGIYLLELNGRYDGSSRFPSNHHWAFFPSGSVGYRFSEEAWFRPLKKTVSNGKIRASFGEIGNEAIGENMFLSTMARRTSGLNWLGNTSQPLSQFDAPTLVSDELSWERIRTLDLGLDLGFFGNELNTSFDWFERNTIGMLAPAASMPAVLGASAPYTNNGTLRTRGWEFSIDWRHQFGRDLLTWANFNIGDSKSVVTKWDNDNHTINQTYEGKVWGDIWGFETERLFEVSDFTGFDANGVPTGYAAGVADQSKIANDGFHYGPGDVKYKDLDGSGVIDGGKSTQEDHGDLTVIGNLLPRYQYSFRLGAAYKGFDLDMFFQGVGKRDVWTQSSMVYPCVRNADATIFANELDYWKGTWNGREWIVENPQTTFGRLWSGGNEKGTVAGIENGSKNFYPQSRYISHMGYLRLKNLTFGYTLPQALTRRANIEKVRVYFSGENLFEIINQVNGPFDPETGGYKPYSNGGDGSIGNSVFGRVDPFYRTLSFGVQVTL